MLMVNNNNIMLAVSLQISCILFIFGETLPVLFISLPDKLPVIAVGRWMHLKDIVTALIQMKSSN